jgi:hypothetical protein
MSIQNFFVPLAGGRQVNAAGTFFRYESAGNEGTDTSLRLRVDGNDCGSFLPGDSIELPYQGKTWELTPATVNGCSANVKIGLGRITTVRSVLVGGVSITGVLPVRGNAALTSTARTVTNAAANLLGGNSARTYLLIQNKDSAGRIWIAFGGAATQANGILIPPGGFVEWDGSGTVPTGAVSAIGDLASNTNIVTLEG